MNLQRKVRLLFVLVPFAQGCVSSEPCAIEIPAARKSFYSPGESLSISSDENKNGYWVLTNEELKMMLSY